MKKTIIALVILGIAGIAAFVSAREQISEAGSGYVHGSGIYRGIIEQNGSGLTLINRTGT